MLEILVLGLCIGDYRCDQATKAYLIQNPTPKIWLNRESGVLKRSAEEILGKQALIALTTIAAAATQRSYQIKIYKDFSIGRREDEILLLYALSF